MPTHAHALLHTHDRDRRTGEMRQDLCAFKSRDAIARCAVHPLCLSLVCFPARQLQRRESRTSGESKDPRAPPPPPPLPPRLAPRQLGAFRRGSLRPHARAHVRTRIQHDLSKQRMQHESAYRNSDPNAAEDLPAELCLGKCNLLE